MPMDVHPLGDRGFLIRFESEDEAACWSAEMGKSQWPEVIDVVLAYSSVAIYADPDLTDWVEFEARLRNLKASSKALQSGQRICLPVLYDGADLEDAAQLLGLSPAELISRHCGQDYRVFALGFQPGFPYAGYLPDSLAGLVRRKTPRLKVPAGSVAIVGRQTGIYPAESPGGWHLLGRTPMQVVDVADKYFPIQAGDLLRFVPISSEDYASRLGDRL